MSINLVSFFYILIIVSSFLMILSNNPIYSVFFLISIFINTALVFILFNVDFLGIVLLLIYVGAIAILFLFMVMMLNIKKIENENSTSFIVGWSIFSIFFLHIFYILFYDIITYVAEYLLFNENVLHFSNIYYAADNHNNIYIVKKIGVFIFLKYYILLFFCGLLLLVSLIGSIYLTNFKKGYTTKYQYNQFFKKNNTVNTHFFL